MTRPNYEELRQASIAILGFGREGQSTYRLIRQVNPQGRIGIFDGRRESYERHSEAVSDPKAEFVPFDPVHAEQLAAFDCIVKSPGIPPRLIPDFLKETDKITSQAALFLKWFGTQTIGITGTKGKSTTTSLLYHVLRQSDKKVLLGGNIGIPLFDLIPQIETETWVVAELSCHQLHQIKFSPHMAILLNLFEEHLDYYSSKEAYFRSKLNIYRHQTAGSCLFFNQDDPILATYLDRYPPPAETQSISIANPQANFFSDGEWIYHQGDLFSRHQLETQLAGKINLYNILPSIGVAHRLGMDPALILAGIKTFTPLAHRLEFVREVNEVEYYNDSISTIPASTIGAIKALGKVGSLILGGMDRGIDYSEIVAFLPEAEIGAIAFFDKAGQRILAELRTAVPAVEQQINCLQTDSFEEAVAFCARHTPPGQICLLSPAAPSYGKFKNFEERGQRFKEIVGP
jgi:UDP-N-acetylmuramoylalanine--D-glutamate ligase